MITPYFQWLRWPVRGYSKVEPVSPVSKDFPEDPSEIITIEPEPEIEKQLPKEPNEKPSKVSSRLSIWV
jgi:hypothetical protein